MTDDDYTPRTTSTNLPGDPVEQPAVTGRPNDEPEENSTFASRAAAAKKATSKAVSSEGAENKAVGKKQTSRKRTR